MENHAGGLKSYWKKSLAYTRVDGEAPRRHRRRRKTQVIQLAPGRDRPRRRRFWRIRIRPRILLRRVVSFPGRLLAGIRDGYVSLMLRLVRSPALAGYGPDAGTAAFARPAREYDEKVIVEIYKSLLAQGRIFTATDEKEGLVPVPAQIMASQR